MTRKEFEQLIDEKYAEAKKELLEKYDEEQGEEEIRCYEKYYYITPNGGINDTVFNKEEFDYNAMSIGNFFRTRAEAEFEVERLKVIHELKKYAEKNPIFNEERKHYFMYYFFTDECISSIDNIISRRNDIYFSSKKDIEKAIESIGEDRIKKYYFRIGDDE